MAVTIQRRVNVQEINPYSMYTCHSGCVHYFHQNGNIQIQTVLWIAVLYLNCCVCCFNCSVWSESNHRANFPHKNPFPIIPPPPQHTHTHHTHTQDTISRTLKALFTNTLFSLHNHNAFCMQTVFYFFYFLQLRAKLAIWFAVSNQSHCSSLNGLKILPIFDKGFTKKSWWD